MNTASQRPLRALVLMVLVAAPPAWASPPRDHSLSVDLGTNFYGTSTSASFSRRIFDHFWAGAGFQRGDLSFHFPPGSTFFSYTNQTTNDYSFSLSFHELIDLYLAWHWREDTPFWFLNTTKLGITNYQVTADLSYLRQGYSGVYQGSRDYNGLALFVDVVLLEAHPPGDDLSYSLGAKGRFAWLSSPQTIVAQTASGSTQSVILISSDGGDIPILYPEFYLRVDWGF